MKATGQKPGAKEKKMKANERQEAFWTVYTPRGLIRAKNRRNAFEIYANERLAQIVRTDAFGQRKIIAEK